MIGISDDYLDYFSQHRGYKVLLGYCRGLHSRWLEPVPLSFLKSVGSIDETCAQNDDVTGLCPVDSVSFILKGESADSDEEDEVIDEESDASFFERIERWIADIDYEVGPFTV